VDLQNASLSGSQYIALAGTKSGAELEDFIETAFNRSFAALVLRNPYSSTASCSAFTLEVFIGLVDVEGYNMFMVRRPRKDMGAALSMPVVEIGRDERDTLLARLNNGERLFVYITPNGKQMF